MEKLILSDRDVEVLIAYAENDMNERKTSRNAYMSRGTVVYHLNNIRDKTGYDPRKFYDLVKLLNIVSQRNLQKAV